MSRRGNWDRLRMRQRMRSHGVTNAHEDLDAMREIDAQLRAHRAARPKQPPPTKEQQRAAAAQAFLDWRARQQTT